VKKRRGRFEGLETSQSFANWESPDPLEAKIREGGENKNAARVVARAAFILTFDPSGRGVPVGACGF
jgi:hypothetical protein